MPLSFLLGNELRLVARRSWRKTSLLLSCQSTQRGVVRLSRTSLTRLISRLYRRSPFYVCAVFIVDWTVLVYLAIKSRVPDPAPWFGSDIALCWDDCDCPALKSDTRLHWRCERPWRQRRSISVDLNGGHRHTWKESLVSSEYQS